MRCRSSTTRSRNARRTCWRRPATGRSRSARLGRAGEALAALDDILGQRPEFEMARLNRGHVRMQVGRLNDAIADLTEYEKSPASSSSAGLLHASGCISFSE
jgi:hypothetical protein